MRWYFFMLLLVLMLVRAPLVGHAAAESASALRQSKELFEAARAEYRARRYQQALELFSEALKLTWRPSIVLNMAQCYRRLGNDEAALAHYRDYLAQWPRYAPGEAPPFETEVRRHIAALSAKLERRRRASEARSGPAVRAAPAPVTVEAWQVATPSVATTGEGELWLVGLPSGAWVRVDGELRAQASETELRLTLLPGQRDVTVQAEGFAPWRRTLLIVAGQQQRERVALRVLRAPGRFWLVAGIGGAALALTAETLALVYTAKANRRVRGSPIFDDYRTRAIASHLAAGLFAATSALSWWLYYRAQNAAEAPGPAAPPALSLLPTRGGAVLAGQVTF